MTDEARDAALANVSAAPADLAEAAKDMDLVIEAVPEKMELKRQIFSTLGAASRKAWASLRSRRDRKPRRPTVEVSRPAAPRREPVREVAA